MLLYEALGGDHLLTAGKYFIIFDLGCDIFAVGGFFIRGFVFYRFICVMRLTTEIHGATGDYLGKPGVFSIRFLFFSRVFNVFSLRVSCQQIRLVDQLSTWLLEIV